MKSKSSKKTESANTRKIRLTTATQQAVRKAELTSKQVQLAKAHLKAARRTYKMLKKVAKKAGKKAGRCEEELKAFLKSLKREAKHKPAKAKAAPARRSPVRKPTRKKFPASSPMDSAALKPGANPASPLL